MNGEPKVKIIVLNWNGADHTINCLRSLEKIIYSNYEVLIVDNGSTDNSEEKIKEAYPHSNILRCPENLGYAGGCNAGIRSFLHSS
jgi:GT2 family glycosyltransferase